MKANGVLSAAISGSFSLGFFRRSCLLEIVVGQGDSALTSGRAVSAPIVVQPVARHQQLSMAYPPILPRLALGRKV